MKAHVWIIFAVLLLVFTFVETKSLGNNKIEKSRSKRSASSFIFFFAYEGKIKKIDCFFPCSPEAKTLRCKNWKKKYLLSKTMHFKCLLCQSTFKCGENNAIF